MLYQTEIHLCAVPVLCVLAEFLLYTFAYMLLYSAYCLFQLKGEVDYKSKTFLVLISIHCSVLFGFYLCAYIHMHHTYVGQMQAYVISCFGDFS